jgi:hypothetical protein
MNWAALSAIVSAITLIGVFGVGGVMWGKLTQTVTDLANNQCEQAGDLKMHGVRLNGVEIDVATLKGWKDGYNTASLQRSDKAKAE